ncbi:hypothetical protein ACFUC1_02990 [Pedococcus sp. NPDC057267]|uniref:hypothetical protein n=1 Tax=Pedococcus sp. NPDC057267 TaxID=3346077 RepID=UPI00363DDD34
MYLGDSHLGGHTHVDFLVREFDAELERIIKVHRYIVKVAARDFDEEYERFLSMHNYEVDGYDGGDAIWDAEQTLGVNPWAVEQHLGLLSLARALSLAEIVMARLAAACWEQPEITVFPKGKTWPRRWEREFYRTCLNVEFDPEASGMGTLRSLRDLYVHGYGVPVHEEHQHELAAALAQHFSAEPPTQEETNLGYEGVASFFGPDARFDAETGVTDDIRFGLPEANVTPLATYRALNRIGERVTGAATAVLSGPRNDVQSSRFVKTVSAWWQRQGGLPT